MNNSGRLTIDVSGAVVCLGDVVGLVVVVVGVVHVNIGAVDASAC